MCRVYIYQIDATRSFPLQKSKKRPFERGENRHSFTHGLRISLLYVVALFMLIFNIYASLVPKVIYGIEYLAFGVCIF